MTYRPRDRGEFWVESRTGDGEHLVDVEEKTCTCKGFEVRGHCEHLEFMLNELSPTEELPLEVVSKNEAETPTKQIAPFDSFKEQVERLKATAETLTITDVSQTAEMSIARETRLALRKIRIEIDHRHKELKEGYLREGQKLDKQKREMVATIEPLEQRLLEQEQFVEREEAKRLAALKADREAELTPYLTGPLAYDISLLSPERYADTLRDAKAAHEARLAREQRELEEQKRRAEIETLRHERALQLAPLVRFIPELDVKVSLGEMPSDEFVKLLTDARSAEKKEAEEHERQRLENERLRKEAEASEAKLKADRAKAAKERAEFEERSRKEREERERQYLAEQARIQAERDAERKRLQAEKERAEAAAREAEAAARKEREALAEKARVEREARESAERELAAQRAAQEKAEADRLAAEEAARLAPEREKLIAFAATVRALQLPEMTTEKGKTARKQIEDHISKFCKYVEARAANL